MNSHIDALGIESLRQVGLDGDMFEHDWVNDPTGEELLDAIEKGVAGRVDSRGVPQAITGQPQAIPGRLRGWRDLYEDTLQRYSGDELQTRIEEAQRESDTIDRAAPEEFVPDMFQPVDDDIDPHKTPKQVEILSGVLKAAQNAPQAKGNKDYWLSTKTNKDGSTKYVDAHRNHRRGRVHDRPNVRCNDHDLHGHVGEPYSSEAAYVDLLDCSGPPTFSDVLCGS